MSPLNDRNIILAGLHDTIATGKIIVGAGAGIGLSAR